ncbi:MAG: hypothetical protein ACMUIU_17035 [bacterium]
MKEFRKYGFWVLFIFIVLIGSLIIVNFSFQKQSPGIPNVNAQGQKQTNFPGDTFYTRPYEGTMGGGHPSDTFYIPQNPVFPGNSNNDYYMPGVITLPTSSTCGWDCGQTYTTCALTCGRGAQGGTSMTCSSGLFGNCLGQTPTSTTCSGGILCGGVTLPTSSTCSSGIFCDGGPMPTFSTCSGGIFCGGPSPTSTTCGVFCDGGPMPTFSTCSSGFFCDGGAIPTSSTCSGGIFCGSSSPTSTTCSGSIFCGGNISTLQTCFGNCSTELPLSLPEGVIPGWGGNGPKIPGSIVPFPVYNAPPSY